MQDFIYAVHPLIINKELVWDIFCLNKVIRVYNIKLEFLVHKLPGLTINGTLKLIESYIKNTDYRKTIKLDIVDNYTDACCFNFEHKDEYVEVSSKNPMILKEFYDIIDKDLQNYYTTVDETELEPYDEIFYRNSETPYRFTFANLFIGKTPYLLPGKYGIPLVGDITINRKHLESTHNKFKQEEYPMNYNIESIFLLDFNNLTKCIIPKKDTKGASQNSMSKDMVLMAYDIETTGLNPKIDINEIICIGMGFFHITDNKPYKRVCIISKNFDKLPNDLKHKGNKDHVTVYNEYSNDPNDRTEYIIAEDEEDLLYKYINVVKNERPQIITSFNGFGFDDGFVHQRTMRYHELNPEDGSPVYELNNSYKQLFTPYNIGRFSNESWFEQLYMPKLIPVELKIDGMQYKDNHTMRSETILLTDIYKIILKEDPKRFTVCGRGNLNTMLATFNTKNPYNNVKLSKSGLSIKQMFKNWEENKDIYEIALYCCQDAWICGTLMINKSTIIDKINMSRATMTSLKDSFYRADSHRVSCCVMSYAYQNKFAVQDSPYESRKSTSQKHQLGGKEFDTRTYVGGAVKNYLPGNHKFVVAIDYSAMYPTNKMEFNIDASARVDERIIEEPEKFGLKIVKKMELDDMLGKRERYYVKRIRDRK